MDIFKGLTVNDSVKLLLCQSIDQQSNITIFGYTLVTLFQLIILITILLLQ